MSLPAIEYTSVTFEPYRYEITSISWTPRSRIIPTSLILGLYGPTLLVEIDTILPSNPASMISFIFVTAGLNLSICPTIKIRFACLAALIITSAFSIVSTIGFSTRTFTFAARASRVTCLCSIVGTTILTASRPSASSSL